ncbi:hypothetical protein K501DRAFT_262610 [Backusella circina FSU 941]|nr:hypothetical protein K501DRAFT_262610 [Backusella circina FSU 941]
MQGPAMTGFVFVDFNDRITAEKAYEALKTIHFGLYYKPVIVEFAKPNPKRKINSYGPTPTIEEIEKAADPIAPRLGVKYPPNPHLRYQYPDPTPDILYNITNAMGSVPRFYTQVLHLMNKLNLSPPFGPIHEQPPPPMNLRKRKKDDLLASDESELSDEEEEMTAEQQEQVVKRARLNRMAAEQQKQALKSAPKSVLPPVKPPQEQEEDKIKIVLKRTTDAQQAIQDQCKPLAELTEWPAFKNYQAGTPSTKLYIKNLSKKTTVQDLNSIFSLFSSNIEIQLLTKGRLREQAFITFPDKETAATALECTNGYVVMDRPMAVMFGRSEK